MTMNGYTQINNTLLWAVMQLPKWERLAFTCLRIESDYTSHLTNFLTIKNIVEFTGLKRQSVDIAIRSLEKKGWIAKVEKKGYAYQWELSIAKLTNAEVSEFLKPSSEADSQLEMEFTSEPQSEVPVPAADRFQIEKSGNISMKTLTFGPRVYRYNDDISDFETRVLWKDGDAWERANGHTDLLSEEDKIQLQAHAYNPS